MTRSDHHQATPFGPRFGKLVRAYRDDLGMSARDLAVRVWDDAGRKASISRLENGHVLRPEAKTIQAIAYALDIPPDEIETLRLSKAIPPPALPAHLESMARTGRDQLEALASRFEIGRVYDRSDDELRKLLEWKAQEYRAYRSVLDGADSLILIDGETRQLAKNAASSLDFDALEGLLASMDNAQSRLSAEIKEKRAANALLRGRVTDAFRILTSAAEVMGSVDQFEMASRRNKYHKLLYDHGLRYPGPGLELAIEIQRPAVAAVETGSDRDDWARYLQNLGNALASFGARAPENDAISSINEAISVYRLALGHLTKQDHPEIWGMVQHNLGAALYLRGTKTMPHADRTRDYAEAVTIFGAALEIRRIDTHPDLWAMTLQNLAVALKEQGRLIPGPDGHRLIEESICAFMKSLSVRTHETNPMEWAMTRENLALAEFAFAEHIQSEASMEHFAKALDHVNAALKVYDSNSAPFYLKKAEALRQRLLELLPSTFSKNSEN